MRLSIGRRFGRCAAQVAVALIVATSVIVSIETPASAADQYGGFGPEGSRMREQLWVLPSGDQKSPMRATLFRPAQDSSAALTKLPLVVINHGTDDATRLAVSMPVYYWLSRWFVERGYAVVLPQRRGHGATGGPLSESVGTCAQPDHFASGNAAADDIEAAIDFMTSQPFIAPKGAIVIGISTGGWASLALAARNPPKVAAIVNFAGGRGGHAYGQANVVCGPDKLLSAAHQYAVTARVPTIWYYAANDSYFGPKLATDLAQVWSEAGGSVEAHILPPYGNEGHSLADDRMGWDIWGKSLQSFLDRNRTSGGSSLEMAAERSAGKDLVSLSTPVVRGEK